MTIDQAIELGVKHHQGGRLRDAEGLYRQVLSQQPEHADALHLLGVIAFQTGNYAAAVELIGKAIGINGGVADYYANLGVALAGESKLDQAIAAFGRAVQLQPIYPIAHHHLARLLARGGQTAAAVAEFRLTVAQQPDNAQAFYGLGNALHAGGELEPAIAAYQQAATINPQYHEALNNLGNTLCMAGRHAEAVPFYRRALAAAPQSPTVNNNLGSALTALDDVDGAIECFQRALALQPDSAQFLKNLADAYLDKQDHDRAIVYCRQALAVDANYADAYGTLGNALYAKGELEQAAGAYRQMLALRPDAAEAHNNLGAVLLAAGCAQEATEHYRRTLQLSPDLAIAHWNLGLVLLRQGELAAGWPEYQWRWKIAELGPRMQLGQPLWDGSDLSGRRILLYAEQGFGDVIQFARYLPMVAARGGRIILACHVELHRLLRGMGLVHEWIGPDEMVPAYDTHCPLMSLPLVFKTTLENIPSNVPYLSADPAMAASWAARLADDDRKKVGLVWAGGPGHANDRYRSLPLHDLAPLANVPGVRYISLQKGLPAAQAKVAPMELADWTDELNDFADTAALAANLDLVITVDTAMAHLAGAMAKPVWVLLPFVPDWRWMLERADSPWYPSMKLYRQRGIGEWKDVIGRIVRKLRDNSEF